MSFPEEEGTMSTAVARIPQRIPPKGLSEKVFTEHIKTILPLLYKVAATIARPPHIDDEDLVQEACLHLYRNRHNFDGSVGANINTWCVTVARRRLLNVAKRSFGSTKHPKNAEGVLKHFVSLKGAAEIVPTDEPSPFDTINFRETLEAIKKKLPPFALYIFMLYIEMPDDFIDFLESKGATNNGSIHFITNEHLVEYTGVSYGKIMQAKRKIKAVIKKAIS